MKDLIERIKELRLEIKSLKYERNGIQKQIDQKEDVLEELEKLTVNQLDMFEGLAKHDTSDIGNTYSR